MRLRLSHQLSLLLLLAVLAAVSVMGAVVSWNLREGFLDYLEARDAERLDRFVAVTQAAWAHDTASKAPANLRDLLDELAVAEGLPRATPEPTPATPAAVSSPVAVGQPPPAEYRPPRRRHPQERGEPPPHRRPPRDRWGDDHPPPHLPPRPPRDERSFAPPPPVESAPAILATPAVQAAAPVQSPPRPVAPPPETHRWGRRLAIEDLSGRVISGHPRHPERASLTRTIQVGGKDVAIARLYLGQKVPEGVDARFLARQYGAIAATAAALGVLALIVAGWVARRWLRPINAVQAAAHRVARGEFTVRVAPGGSGELADLARSMNAMAESLEKLEKARRRWIAELSHELRTPLAVLRGELEALQDGIRPCDDRAIASLQGEVGQITRLVDDLHLLAMFDLKRMPCSFAACDAVALIEQAIKRVDSKSRAAGLVIAFDHPSRLDVAWDAGRIMQLLGNLLENSIKYTDAPGRIEVHLERDDEYARITIEDSPPGVRDFEYAALFEPLYRADASRNRASGGSGLGLAIVESICAAHGGSIRARASSLGGLAVDLMLPLNPVK